MSRLTEFHAFYKGGEPTVVWHDSCRHLGLTPYGTTLGGQMPYGMAGGLIHRIGRPGWPGWFGRILARVNGGGRRPHPCRSWTLWVRADELLGRCISRPEDEFRARNTTAAGWGPAAPPSEESYEPMPPPAERTSHHRLPCPINCRLAGGWWLVLIYSERKVLLAGCWWLICSERKVLLADG
jgi:hypothetical protein